MDFKNSNIVERMGALTLIIIGEGIIGMMESVSSILKTSAQISVTTIGLVISVVMLIYVLWMLYFDHTDKVDHSGARINKEKPWCQLWTILHYPLHVAILLTLEGSASFMLWWNVNEASTFLVNELLNAYDIADNGVELFQPLKFQLLSISDKYPSVTSEIQSDEFQSNLTALRKLGTLNGTTNDDNTALDVIFNMSDDFLSLICEKLEIAVPEALGNTTASSASQSDAAIAGSKKIDLIFGVFFQWFIVFFVAGGCVIILLALARCIGHQKMPIAESVDGTKPRLLWGRRPLAWAAITLQCLIGVALALISLSARYQDTSSYWSFTQSPWLIPTVLIAFSLGKSSSATRIFWSRLTNFPYTVIICDNTLYYWSSDVLHPPEYERAAACSKCGRSNSIEKPEDFATDSRSPLLE
jgi:hypothetical protein